MRRRPVKIATHEVFWGPDHDRPRVLIEHPDGAERWADEQILHQAGYDVRTCGGPGDAVGGSCPLLQHRPCPLVAGADVVWNGLVHAEHDRRVLEGQIHEHPTTPVVVEVTEPRSREMTDLLAYPNVVAVHSPVNSRRLLEGIGRGIGRSHRLARPDMP